MPQPSDTDPVTHRETCRTLTGVDNFADDLVPGDDTWPVNGQITFSDMQVGPADAAGSDGDEEFTGRGNGNSGPPVEFERTAAHRTRVLNPPGTH